MSASLCRDISFNSLFFTVRHCLIANWEAEQDSPVTKFQAYLAGIIGGKIRNELQIEGCFYWINLSCLESI